MKRKLLINIYSFISNKQEWLIFLAILIIAVFLRLAGVAWDQNQHLHPDERYMTMVASEISWPSSLSEYLNPETSSLSPINKGYDAYVYGTFPLFLVKATADLVGDSNYNTIPLVGRVVSSVFDLGTLILLFWLGKKIFFKQIGLIAMALYAFAVSPIQHSHYFTVDNFLTFFIIVCFVLIVKFIFAVNAKKRWLLSLLGLAVGLGFALACKYSAIYFLPILIIVFAYLLVSEFGHSKKKAFGLFLFRSLILLVGTYLVFRFLQPYFFANNNWLDFTINPKLQATLHTNYLIQKGEILFPPAWHWVNTQAFLYPLKNIALWGLGPPIFLSFVLGIGILLRELFRKLKKQQFGQEIFIKTLIIIWIFTGFFAQAGNFTKEMRYFLFIMPFVVLLAGNGLAFLLKQNNMVFKLLALMAIVLSFFWAWAFIKIYLRDTTRVSASLWMQQNIPAGSLLANEAWDDPMPVGIPQDRGIAVKSFSSFLMEVYNQDARAKLQVLYQDLTKADYIILSSPRASWTIGRLPDKFPIMFKYYQYLDSGEMGFNKVKEVSSFPEFFGLKIDDSPADEAFWVFDHPKVRIYQKTKNLTWEEFQALFAEINF